MLDIGQRHHRHHPTLQLPEQEEWHPSLYIPFPKKHGTSTSLEEQNWFININAKSKLGPKTKSKLGLEEQNRFININAN